MTEPLVREIECTPGCGYGERDDLDGGYNLQHDYACVCHQNEVLYDRVLRAEARAAELVTALRDIVDKWLCAGRERILATAALSSDGAAAAEVLRAAEAWRETKAYGLPRDCEIRYAPEAEPDLIDAIDRWRAAREGKK